jgi:rhodanese-related sulfurtransferase
MYLNGRPPVMPNQSALFAVPPVDSETAARHFRSKLALEVDAWDLHQDLLNRIPGIVLVDARKPSAYEAGHIPGAINLPHRQINAESTSAFSKEALYITYCVSVGCNAGTKAAFNLASLGFNVKELLDGLRGWEEDGFELALGKEPGNVTA